VLKPALQNSKNSTLKISTHGRECKFADVGLSRAITLQLMQAPVVQLVRTLTRKARGSWRNPAWGQLFSKISFNLNQYQKFLQISNACQAGICADSTGHQRCQKVTNLATHEIIQQLLSHTKSWCYILCKKCL